MVANIKDIPRHYYSLEEYFALEKVGEARYEYWDGDIVCMSGGSPNHYQLTTNILGLLFEKLRGKECRPLVGDAPIHTPKYPPYRYPDAGAVCGDPKYKNFNGIHALENPILLVEVLSETTEHADKNQKRIAYQAIQSLQEYMLVAQNELHVIHYVRQGKFWSIKDYREMSAIIEFSSIEATITVAEIYRNVSFAE